MAKFGLKGFYVATLSETGSNISYTNGKKVSKAVSLSESRSYDEAKLYADDGLADSVKALSELALTMVPDGLTPEEESALIGKTLNASLTIGEGTLTNAYTTGDNDEGSAVGFGCYVQERIAGVASYKAIIYPKVKFAPSDSVEYSTRGESTEFVTTEYSGKAYKPDVPPKDYIIEVPCTTENEAEGIIRAVLAVPTTYTETQLTAWSESELLRVAQALGCDVTTESTKTQLITAILAKNPS